MTMMMIMMTIMNNTRNEKNQHHLLEELHHFQQFVLGSKKHNPFKIAPGDKYYSQTVKKGIQLATKF